MLRKPENLARGILPFGSYELARVDQVGGKALALMQMCRAGMPVPPGIVLTVRFFEPWILALSSSPAWAALAHADPGEIQSAAKALQIECEALELSQQQTQELDEALRALRQETHVHLFSVRSSSPEEDMEGASFAGGYETTLGVTPETLHAAILRSFTSGFHARVFLYKREHGIRINEPRIAIIVQAQVDAESAGVAFSLNPLNNCYDEAVVNANFGLGESVVSGEADPDVFVIDKLKREILERRIGSKQVVITPNPGGGTSKSGCSAPAEPSITDAQALELVALLLRVEAYYRKPIDIEWAIAGGAAYLLQARPITTYLPLPDEMVTAPGESKRLYANSTLIEQGVQGPLSVLGTEFLSYVLNHVGGPIARDAIGLDGAAFTAGGGYYINLSYTLKMGMGSAALSPGNFGDPRVTAILDSIDIKQYLTAKLPAKLRAARGRMLFSMIPIVRSVLKAYLRPDHFLRDYHAASPGAIQRLEALSDGGTSLESRATALSETLDFFYGEYGIPMILASQIAQQRIKNLFKQEAAQVQDHLINLGISLPGNKTTEMGESLYALASLAEISLYDSAADFLAALERRALSPEFMRRWEGFIAEFGMRCPSEIDAATPRPWEQPALLFQQVKNMALAVRSRTDPRSFFEEARLKREAAYQTLHGIALKKGKRRARALEKYYATWVTLGGYRETPKHYVIKVIDLFRRQALALAQSFVAAGRLDRPEEIFDLTIGDIDRAREDVAVGLRALARERSALVDSIRRSHLVARVIDSRGRIYYPPPKAATEGELRGVPISPGIVQGRVKVVHDAHRESLLPGEILVARATDPGWTPLFINARGIILEIGGALQHGAVVAREYGIPCVSGVDEATRKLRDGQRVEVDGSNGIVRILPEPT